MNYMDKYVPRITIDYFSMCMNYMGKYVPRITIAYFSMCTNYMDKYVSTRSFQMLIIVLEIFVADFISTKVRFIIEPKIPEILCTFQIV